MYASSTRAAIPPLVNRPSNMVPGNRSRYPGTASASLSYAGPSIDAALRFACRAYPEATGSRLLATSAGIEPATFRATPGRATTTLRRYASRLQPACYGLPYSNQRGIEPTQSTP